MQTERDCQISSFALGSQTSRDFSRKESAMSLPARHIARPVMIVPGADVAAIRQELSARYKQQPAPANDPPPCYRRISHVRAIQREVAEAYKRSVDDLWTRSQVEIAVLARYEIFFRARHETSMSLSDIAAKCGGYDLTTVFYAIRKTARLLETGWRMRTRPDVVGVSPAGLVTE